METTLTSHRTPLRLAFTLLATLSLLASQVAVFNLLPAEAASVGPGTDGGDFEIDGDFDVDSDTYDWANRSYTSVPDAGLVFGGGSNAQEPNRQNWTFQNGDATPGKDNLLRGYVDSHIDFDGDEAWIRVGAERAKGNGTAWASFEFNQDNAGPFVSGTTVPRTPAQGDLLVSFQFPGNASDAPQVIVEEWTGSGWDDVALDAYGAANAVQITSHQSGATLDEREFMEVSVDVGFLFREGATCRSFGQAWVRSNTAYGDNGQLKDVLSPVEFGFDTCADLTLRKQDTNGTGQADVGFELYEGSEVAGEPSATCTTGDDGNCDGIEGLEPGTYTAYEVAPPAGFKLSKEGRTQTFELERFADETITFTNPPITYRIEVTPDDDTNAVGYTHEFEVELFADFVYDYETDTYVPSDSADIPLDGETVGLSWSGPGSSAIVEVNEATLDPAETATSCTTDADGSCTVDVLSDTVGSGTLTASYDTPLGGPAASDPANSTNGGYFSQISDSGAKGWIGYEAELDGDFDNPLGEDHTFTATVRQVNADGSEELAADVDVSFGWDGPAGSDFDGDVDTCTTDGTGTCDVTITSPDDAGTGTLTIAEVSGEIVENETLTIAYSGEDAPSATKTWWDYRATVETDAVNPISESHTFDITVERTDGSVDGEGATIWLPALDDTTVDYDWTGVGTEDGETCSTGTVDGTCSVTVSSDVKGTGTITVTGITTTLGGYNLEDEVEQPFSFDVDDDSATKSWVDWMIDITFDAENPAGESHTFTVTAKVWDPVDEQYVLVPDGTTLTLAYSDGSLVDDDSSCTDTGTIDGSCTIVASSDDAATLTVTVTGIAGTDLPGYPNGTASYTFPEGDQAASTKEWIEYRVVGDDDAYNLAGDDHDFALTAEERREGGDWEALEDVTLDVSLEAGSVGTMDANDCTDVGTNADGECTVTVSSDVAGSATVTVDAIDGIELLDGGPEGSTTIWDDVAVDEASQTKTWVVYDVTLDGDAVNNLGDDHDFTATVTVDDGSGAVPANLADVDGVFTYDDESTLDVDCTTNASGECALTIPAPEDGGEAVASSGELVLTEVSHTYAGEPFTVDLTGTDGLGAQFDQPAAIKDWIDYSLIVTPPDATNLLPDFSEHTFTVTLSSSDEELAPTAGEDIDLDLESDVAAIIKIIDDTGSRTFNAADEVTSETCTTTDAGICEVTVVSTTPGTADLTASFDATVDGASFDLEDEGSKLWTTFRVSVNPQNAQNLLGTPHLFTVTVEQTDIEGDEVVWTPVEGAVPTLDVTAPAFIDDHDCDDGTDADGQCTATVDSDESGVFTFTADHEGAVGDQTAAFSDSGDKAWIDYQVEVNPEIAENLTGTDHVFTVTVNADIGDGWEPVSGAMPDVELAGPGTIIDEDCSDGTTEDGTCTVTIRSAETGVSTLTATYQGAAGGGDFDNAPETADFIDDGTKLWVDYLLEVTPETAINALDDPHTYTVTLLRDEGGDPFGADDETVDLAIDGPGEITDVADGTVGSEGDTATCTTDGDGTCDVTIVSSEAGTTTLTATYDAIVGVTTGTFTADAEKQWAAIDLVKTALIDEDEDGLKSVTFSTDPDVDAPVITYEYTITNEGPVALTVTELTDDVLGTIALPDPLVLEPGESATATADHEVTADDADAGDIVNVAEVFAEADDGTEVSDSDDEEVFVITVLATGSIDLIKTALVDRDDDGNRVVEVDEGETAVVTYRYRITNNGNVAISDLSLTDDKIGDISVPEGTVLEPGDSITVEADYTVTDGDFSAGEVENVGLVTGQTPDGVEVTDDDDEVVTLVEVLEVVEVLEEVEEVEELPETGADSNLMIVWGLLLSVIGTAALLFTPRRRRGDA